MSTRGLAAALVFLALAGACSPASPSARGRVPRFGKLETPPASALIPETANRERSVVLTVDAGIAGDRITSWLEVPDTECAIAIARATPTVEDVDLFAYGDDGALLGSDEATDKNPALLVCPPHPRRVFLVARIAAGHGLIALGAERVAVADAERTAATYGVRYRPGEVARRMSLWPGLDEQLEAHRREIGGDWSLLRRVPIPLDARTPTRLSTPIEAGRCLDALILPSDEIAALDVTLLDADGRLVGRAQGTRRERSLVACSPISATVTLELRPRHGIGFSVVMLSESRAGSESAIDPEVLRLELHPMQPLAEERARLADALERDGYPSGRLVAKGELSLGQRSSQFLNLGAGCSRLDVVGGAPLRGMSAWLYAEGGELVASDHGSSSMLFACGKAARRVRLDLEASSLSGPYAVELRPEPGTPKALEEDPLAASRLVSHMIEHAVIGIGRRVGAVGSHLVSSDGLVSQELMVAAGRCVDVTAAIGRGGAGIELRLVDKTSLVELDRGRGESAASARVCATNEQGRGTLELRAELRLSAGRATALVTAHTSDPKSRVRTPGPPR